MVVIGGIYRRKNAVVVGAQNVSRQTVKADGFWFVLAPTKTLHNNHVIGEQFFADDMLT